MEKVWIWQGPQWPAFSYDSERLAEPLRRARTEFGRLLGKAEMLDAHELLTLAQDVWSEDAVSTAAIEGEELDSKSVRSSTARRLGIPPALVEPVPRNIEGLLDVMQNAVADWDNELTQERVCRWQAALFPGGGTALRSIQTGQYRAHDDPMEIVSGPIGRETVHYVAPPSAVMRSEIHNFLAWFNRSRTSGVDGILRAGLAHIWFESIHPFEDGNGRVGRAIIDLALAQDARNSTRLHGVSSELHRRQSDYYAALNQAQRGSGEITAWLGWFANVFADSCAASGRLIGDSLLRSRFWSDHKEVTLNERQSKVINKMLEAGPRRFEGGLTQRKYAAMTRVSAATSWRDIEDLVKKGMITPGSAGGRSTYYDLAIPGWEWLP
jgi:Fic family protein